MHNELVHFYGLDIVVLGHLWADWGTQAVYFLIFNIYYLQSHTHTHARACALTMRMKTGTENDMKFASFVAAMTIHFRATHFSISAQRKQATKAYTNISSFFFLQNLIYPIR